MWGLQAPEHPAVAVLKFALIFEPGVPRFHFFTGSANSAAGPSERSHFLFSLLTLLWGAGVGGGVCVAGIHSDGKVKVQRFVWVSEPVKVMGTARCQLVELTACHLVAPGTEHQGCVCPGCSLSWPKLVWAKGSRGGGHLTAQVQVQGLKHSSQQLVSAGPGDREICSW